MIEAANLDVWQLTGTDKCNSCTLDIKQFGRSAMDFIQRITSFLSNLRLLMSLKINSLPTFIQSASVRVGCQQLQLNHLRLDTLLDARIHPENHKNLIVRIWGRSSYFCELAREYQDHIIALHLYEIN